MNSKERGTIIFALEEYAQLLERENSYLARNKVYELIYKLDRERGQVK